MKKIILSVITIVILGAASSLFAQGGQDDSTEYNNSSDAGAGVNSGSFGLILQGSVGYGATMFGVVYDSSSSSSIGVGPGAGFDIGIMANYSIFAVKLAYTYSSLEDLKWNQKLSGTTYEMETKGEGDYSTFDALLGLKLFTEPEDMGYTHVFAGYRFWSITRKENERLIDGLPGSVFEYELSGGGWIAGIHDLSTFPLGLFSIALKTAIWFDSAPFDTYKRDGGDVATGSEEAFGFGVDLGIGIAFEDIGVLVLAGWKMDIIATTYSDSIMMFDDNVVGAGYSLFYLSLAKEF